MKSFITRDEALRALYTLLDSCILSEELDEKIECIASANESEKRRLI